MSNIDSIIDSLTVKPKFIHNDFTDFVPGKTPVFYSGPYWDNQEVRMALKGFLTGKWLSSGENVYKFEKKFVNK